MNQQVIAAIRLAPVAPWWLIGVLAALCAAALAVAFWRRAPGSVWRALAFVVLLFWLSGPRLVQETRRPLPDIGLLVIDQSASMRVGERARLAAAAQAALELDGRRQLGLELRTVTVPESGQDGTRLFTTIDRALAGIPAAQLAGVIAITDGQAHDAPITWRPEVPLHMLLAGAGEQIDRRIRLIEAPGFGVVGKSVTLRAVVEDLGAVNAPAATAITIRRDGEPPSREAVTPGQPREIELPITREGPSVVELSVDPLAGEASALNNRVAVEINGVRDRLRVLLVSGEPHAGERTWRRLLKADPAVDLVHFTILRPPEKDDLTPLNELALIAFPTRELFQQKIGEFDLIILDRFQNRGILPLPYLRNIADYVRRGGALLLSVGPEFAGAATLDDTPLRAILPAHPIGVSQGAVPGGLGEPQGDAGGDGVIDGVFRPSVTALGARHPVTAGLPGWHPDAPPDWGPWYRHVATGEAHGQVLMSAGPPTVAGDAGAPLLLLDRVDKGRVALLLSDQIWLWSRGHQGGGPQAELLRRIAHWLMRQPALEEDSLTARVSTGAEGARVTVTRTTTEDAPPPELAVVSPDGGRAKLALQPASPGQASGGIAASLPGVWTASDGTRTAYAAVNAADAIEFSDLRATAGPTAKLAAASGGGIHWLSAPGATAAAPSLRRSETGRAASGATWIGLPARGAHVVAAVAAVPLLPDWLALALLGSLVIVAWWREAA